MPGLTFPNEATGYREARDELLKAEIALRAEVERVAAIRRELPPGGLAKEDFTFMLTLRSLALILAIGLAGASYRVAAQNPAPSEGDVAAIDAVYAEWSQALAARGAEGYASFFVADGAVLPPDGQAVEGRDAIRKWIQKVLDESTVKDARLSWGPLRISNGMAVRRFTLSGQRVPKKGGDPTRFNNKYVDVLQKQPDGSWKFVYRMWSSNEG